MPDRITALISIETATNDLPNVIPKLARLLEHDPKVEVAYLCTPSAVQISKLPGEGAHFCGYRNIQMLLLSLASDVKCYPAAARFKERRATIPEVQDLIESAWDQGINAHGRIQTGGICGTRKHIGTSEVYYACA